MKLRNPMRRYIVANNLMAIFLQQNINNKN